MKFNELMDLILDYVQGKPQNSPQIIWFDKNTEPFINEITESYPNTLYDLANCLAEKSDNKIGFMGDTGGPLSNSRYLYRNGKRVRITDIERAEFSTPAWVIKYDQDGNLITKLYIHAPFIFGAIIKDSFGEHFPNSFEYGVQVKQELNLPVMIFLPLKYKEQISSIFDLSDYKQEVCEA